MENKSFEINGDSNDKPGPSDTKDMDTALSQTYINRTYVDESENEPIKFTPFGVQHFEQNISGNGNDELASHHTANPNRSRKRRFKQSHISDNNLTTNEKNHRYIGENMPSKDFFKHGAPHHAENHPGISRRRISSQFGTTLPNADTIPVYTKHKPSKITFEPDAMLESPSNENPSSEEKNYKLFVQLDEYCMEEYGISGHHYWREIARWIKYEEDLEENSARWGKPHVPILSFHGLAELRKRLETGTVILDMEEIEYSEIMHKIACEVRDNEHIEPDQFLPLMNCLMKPHRQIHTKTSFIPDAKQILSLLTFPRSKSKTFDLNTGEKNVTNLDKTTNGIKHIKDTHLPMGNGYTNFHSSHTENQKDYNNNKNGNFVSDNLKLTEEVSIKFLPENTAKNGVENGSNSKGLENGRPSFTKSNLTTSTLPKSLNNRRKLNLLRRIINYLRLLCNSLINRYPRLVYGSKEAIKIKKSGRKRSSMGVGNFLRRKSSSFTWSEGQTTCFIQEGALVMVGGAAFLATRCVTVFVRLQRAVNFPSGVMEDENIPVRFIFILLGPQRGTIPTSMFPITQSNNNNLISSPTTNKYFAHNNNDNENDDINRPMTPIIQSSITRGRHKIDSLSDKCDVSTRASMPSRRGSCNISPLPTQFMDEQFRDTAAMGVGTNQLATIQEPDYKELGRSFATLLSNESFNSIAYKAQTCKELTSAFNNMLKDAIVLPPGDFGRSTLMPISSLYKEQLLKKRLAKDQKEWGKDKGLDEKSKKDDIVKDKEDDTKPNKWEWRKPFGGLINDVKRKLPFYKTDFTNAFHLQCASTFIFIYFACLSPCITFGGILSYTTENWMGVSEMMIATCVGGCIFALFSGQPLAIVGATGPMLIFEDSLYKFSKQNQINYLSYRVWVAMWVFVITIIFLAAQAGVLIRYLTRFIQEIFSILISFIFIYETFYNLKETYQRHPLLPDYCHLNVTIPPSMLLHQPVLVLTFLSYSSIGHKATTSLLPPINTNNYSSASASVSLQHNISVLTSMLEPYKVPISGGSNNNSSNATSLSYNNYVYQIPYYYFKYPKRYILSDITTQQYTNYERLIQVFKIIRPNTALFCTLLMFGTFFIAYFLKVFRNSKFFGRGARRFLADFGVPIAILSMIAFAYAVGKNVYIPKLNVPSHVTPTAPEKRSWSVRPLHGGSKPLYKTSISQDVKLSNLNGIYSTSNANIPSYYYTNLSVAQIFFAILPAFMIFILIFLEGMITCLIVNRKDRRFIKGAGYNLDLLVLGTLPLIHSFMGLPFVSGATVRSLAHVSSLTVFSKLRAPGEPPAIIGVLEQRVTAFMVSLCIGLSMFFSVYLQKIPTAVLFGIFLYMGVSSLKGIQFFDRILIFLMPLKHYPTLNYVKNVGLFKLHFYTLIQLLCLIALWAVRLTVAAQAFPFVLIIFILIRFQLGWIYTPRELTELDKEDVDDESDEDIDITEEIHMPI